MPERKHRRKGGGRRGKITARKQGSVSYRPYIERKIPYFEILNEEGLATIEQNAEILLEEIGIEIRDFPRALELFKNAGADIEGERVRFPQGMCRELIQSNAPSEYTQHARNPKNNVVIGGKNTVLVPGYGPPFVRDLDKGRRYATLEDFQNFGKFKRSLVGLIFSCKGAGGRPALHIFLLQVNDICVDIRTDNLDF